MPSCYNPILREQVTLLLMDRNWGEKGFQLRTPAGSEHYCNSQSRGDLGTSYGGGPGSRKEGDHSDWSWGKGAKPSKMRVLSQKTENNCTEITMGTRKKCLLWVDCYSLLFLDITVYQSSQNLNELSNSCCTTLNTSMTANNSICKFPYRSVFLLFCRVIFLKGEYL